MWTAIPFTLATRITVGASTGNPGDTNAGRLEAGVNINTVVRKLPGGGWVFPEINERFEELKQKRQRPASGSDLKEEKITELRNEVDRLRKENRLLALEINHIGRQVLEERERADRMSVYERQNASLREEIAHIQARGRSPLNVVGKHEN